jgi:hypothetical protein
MPQSRISDRIINPQTHQGVPGLRVEAWEKEPIILSPLSLANDTHLQSQMEVCPCSISGQDWSIQPQPQAQAGAIAQRQSILPGLLPELPRHRPILRQKRSDRQPQGLQILTHPVHYHTSRDRLLEDFSAKKNKCESELPEFKDLQNLEVSNIMTATLHTS